MKPCPCNSKYKLQNVTWAEYYRRDDLGWGRSI